MKIRLFVMSSAAILAAWLGVTFFREVPRETYPQLGRKSAPITAKVEERKSPLVLVEEPVETPELVSELVSE